MGTETYCEKTMMYNFVQLVKLNNPQMGTETAFRFLIVCVSSLRS